MAAAISKYFRDFAPDKLDLTNKSVLVTGGTGSFGHAFVEYALNELNVERLVVFSRDELKQWEMQQIYPHTKYPQLRFFIGDVRDEDRLRAATRQIDIIVHAAALKQVIAMEYNPFECTQTNINGAENVVRAAIENKVERVVALSTDKAAEPVNLYGATKLASDKIFVAANNIVTKDGPRFAVVRYGNVANSRGSVIPAFQSLIKNGVKRLPVTDPEMTRFIITLDQGVKFSCLALRHLLGGEIFVPKIPSLRIVDLAEAMLPGKEPEVVGIRPGEKLHEALIPQPTARHVLESEDFYMIQPELAYREYDRPNDLKLAPVQEDFSYYSNTNNEFLDVDDIKELVGTV